MDIANISLTEEEVEEIKTRLVERILTGMFMERGESHDEDYNWSTYRLKAEIAREVKRAARDQLKEMAVQIARETIAPRMEEAARKLTDRFVEQTEKIVNKINWYWSLK